MSNKYREKIKKRIKKGNSTPRDIVDEIVEGLGKIPDVEDIGTKETKYSIFVDFQISQKGGCFQDRDRNSSISIKKETKMVDEFALRLPLFSIDCFSYPKVNSIVREIINDMNVYPEVYKPPSGSWIQVHLLNEEDGSYEPQTLIKLTERVSDKLGEMS